MALRIMLLVINSARSTSYGSIAQSTGKLCAKIGFGVEKSMDEKQIQSALFSNSLEKIALKESSPPLR
jgi:hypothetical protein